MNIKSLFKSTMSALTLSVMMVLVLLNSGCKDKSNSNSNPVPSSDGDIVGTWLGTVTDVEFESSCQLECKFLKNGTGTNTFTFEDGELSFPILWRIDDSGKLYMINEEDMEEDGDAAEWSDMSYSLYNRTLELQYSYDAEPVYLKRVNQ
ncbi:MAG: hypothetical protein MJ010_04770 [Paludibacteraceae bacterium]|nr:hypothetical protein [Paludibacteraceae bacterium]